VATAQNGCCAKCEEYLAGWKRAQADYANLKRETEQFRGEFAKFAAERTLDALLPVFDSFEKAAADAPVDAEAVAADAKRAAQWAAGIGHIRTQLSGALRELGVAPVGEEGEPFDPARHEAVGSEPVAADGTKLSGTVARVIERGWSLHGKVLKPARVVILE